METYNNLIHAKRCEFTQVSLHTSCIHVRAVLVLVRICTTPILLCVYPVSTLLKIWWECINQNSNWGVYLDQVLIHNRRAHVCAAPVFLKIWGNLPLDLRTYCVCFPTNMMTTRPQFPRLWYESPRGLALILLCCWEAAFSNYQIVHELPPPLFFHPDSLECCL